jgi:pimeloyl-ACP methyl ester carboxylesterase
VRKLRSVRAPTLVLHGSDDPLVPVMRLAATIGLSLAGGEDTAANIPGTHLRVVPGMGHFLPEALVPLLVDEIAAHCLKAEDAAQSRFARAAGSSP